MDDPSTPPQTEPKTVMTAPAPSEAKNEDGLVLQIVNVRYDEKTNIATFRLPHAYGNKKRINDHTGLNITFSWAHDDVVPEKCPPYPVNSDHVEREILWWRNAVDVTVTHVDPKDAELTRVAQCFNIPTITVQNAIKGIKTDDHDKKTSDLDM